MDFLSIQGGTVKEGKMAELQQWLAAHEPELRDVCPQGSEYVGTYVTIFPMSGNAPANSSITTVLHPTGERRTCG